MNDVIRELDYELPNDFPSERVLVSPTWLGCDHECLCDFRSERYQYLLVGENVTMNI